MYKAVDCRLEMGIWYASHAWLWKALSCNPQKLSSAMSPFGYNMSFMEHLHITIIFFPIENIENTTIGKTDVSMYGFYMQWKYGRYHLFKWHMTWKLKFDKIFVLVSIYIKYTKKAALKARFNERI